MRHQGKQDFSQLLMCYFIFSLINPITYYLFENESGRRHTVTKCCRMGLGCQLCHFDFMSQDRGQERAVEVNRYCQLASSAKAHDLACTCYKWLLDGRRELSGAVYLK